MDGKLFLTLGIVVLCVFLCTGAFGLSSDLKESYKQSETVVVKLSGNILAPVGVDKVKIERQGHIETPVEKGVKSIGDNTYIWFITPGIADSYSFIVEDVETTVNGVAAIVDYEKTFLVTNEIADYNVKPGVVYSSIDFYLEFNSKKDENLEITLDFPESRTIILKPGYNKIKFYVKNVSGAQTSSMNFGIYSLPAYIQGSLVIPPVQTVNQTGNNTPNNQTVEEDNQTIGWWSWGEENEVVDNSSFENVSGIKLVFDPVILQMVRLKDEEKIEEKFKITNVGEEAASFSLYYNKTRFNVDNAEVIELSVNESKEFNLEYIGDRNRSFGSYIYAMQGDYGARMLVQMAFTNDKNKTSTTPIRQNSTGGIQLYPCSELAGNVCDSGEICSGNERNSADGVCCVGECDAVSSGGGSKSWIGYLVAGICVVILVFVFIKYRKVPKTEANPLQKKLGQIDSGRNIP